MKSFVIKLSVFVRQRLTSALFTECNHFLERHNEIYRNFSARKLLNKYARIPNLLLWYGVIDRIEFAGRLCLACQITGVLFQILNVDVASKKLGKYI